MFGTYGTIQFQTLTAPQEFVVKRETDFAEHARVNTKPKLQKTGEKLDEITLQMHFHVAFCNPDAQVSALDALRKKAKAESLVLGNGSVMGTFVIVSITKTVTDSFSDGSAMACTAEVLLREYATTSRAQEMASEAVSNAFAVRPDAPLPSNPVQTIDSNPSAIVMQSVQEANMASQVSTNAVSLADIPDYAAKASAEINRSMQTITDAMNKVDAAMSTSEALQQQATALPAAVEQARNSALALAALMPIQNISDVREANSLVRSNMRGVQIAAAPVATVTAFRGIF